MAMSESECGRRFPVGAKFSHVKAGVVRVVGMETSPGCEGGFYGSSRDALPVVRDDRGMKWVCHAPERELTPVATDAKCVCAPLLAIDESMVVAEAIGLGVVREDERADRLRQAVCGRLEMDAPGCFEADPTLYAQVCAAVDAAVEATPWVETDPGQYRTRWPRGEEQPLPPAYGHFA